ncbi:hypothetical protein ACMD2_12900 [Ananas comosus]|uniref:Uncharacterized protein n=1 Tax=Ananas comosus TaxID=4615 RepID=A0A199UV06_ANACO|nr:hypothetical protein ACMD2_12900 [Ananas comosus]
MLCRTTAPPLSSFVFSKRIASLHGGAATSYSSSSSAAAAAAAAAAAEPARGGDTKRSSWARRAVPVALLGLTGAVALSAVNDLALFLSYDTWFSFLQHRQWDILLMDAILDVPSNDGNHQMLKVTVTDSSTPPPPPPSIARNARL